MATIKKTYKKDGKRVLRPRVVVIGDLQYINPTDEQLTEAGYTIEEAEYTPKVVVESYGQKVERLIRQRYSLSEELALLRQRESKPEEFAAYNAYCEECKQQVKGNSDE